MKSRTGFVIILAVVVLTSSSCPGFAEVRRAATRATEARAAEFSFVIAIDATESMRYAVGSELQSPRLELARMMAAEILDLVPTGTRCTVLMLQDDVSTIRPLEPLQAGDRSRTRRAMAAIQPNGHGELRDIFLHVEQLLAASPTQNADDSDNELIPAGTAQPFFILVTDGEDCRPGEAHGVAAQLKRQFPELKFLLPGVSKSEDTAAQLQSLALAAAGDSPNLTSQDGIAAALDSVREACDAIRDARRRQLLVAEDALAATTVERDRAVQENERLTALLVDFEKTTEELRDTQRRLSSANDSSTALQESLDALMARHETLISASEETRSKLEEARIDVARMLAEAEGRTQEIEGLRTQLEVAEDSHREISVKLAEQSALRTQLTGDLEHERTEVRAIAEKANNVTIPIVSDLLLLLGLGGAGWVTLKKNAASLLTSVGVGLGEQNAATERIEQERVARVESLQGTLSGIAQRLDRLAFRIEESIPSTMLNAAGESRAAVESIRADLTSVKDSLRGELAAAADSLQARLNHLNDVAESKLHSRFEAVANSQTAISKLIEQVPESVVSLTGTQCQTLHQAIDGLIQAVGRYSDQTQTVVERLAEAEKEHALATSARLEAAQSQISREVRDAAEMACSRMASHETASTRELRDWIGTLSDSLARTQLQSQQSALHAQQERISSALLDALQKAEARVALQISEFRNVTAPGVDRLAERLTELRFLAQQFASQSSQSAQQLAERTMAVLRKLNTIQNELGSAPREVQARGSAPQSPSGVGPASHVVDDFETLSGAAADQAAGFNDTGRSMPQPETPQPAMLQQRIWVRQLKLIPGLGAASARRLIEAGINDIHELATLTEGRLAALATDFPKIRDWTGAAAAIEQLCGIRLVSQANAAELLKSGVHSRTQLRGLSDDEIQSLSESLPQIREWVEAAKLAAAGNDSEENASVSDAERSGAGGEASDAGQEESSRDGAASDN